MRALRIFLSLCLASSALAGTRPVISMMTTCAQLTQNLYPADTTTWFDAGKQPQVVFYAHLLFPLKPELDALESAPAWHPPMAVTQTASPGLSLALSDNYYAQAQWLDPDGVEVARYGLTMPARVSTDYVRLGNRQYIPHTFTMTLGIKDLRAQAGQKLLPSKNGQYHVRLYVDGQLEGIAFFRMLQLQQTPLPAAAAPIGVEAAPKALAPAVSNPLGEMLRLLTQTAK